MTSISTSNIHPRQTSNRAGVLWAFCAVGLFSLIYVSGKLSGTPASALQIIWLRYVGGFLTMLFLILCGLTPAKRLSTSQPLLHACRAAVGGFGGVAAVYAAANMPVASASAIGLLDGLFTIVLGILILDERAGVRQWLATLACLLGAGVVLVSQGAFSDWNAAFQLSALIALAGAVLVAAENILIKTLVHTEHAITVLFYVNLFGSIILAIPGVAHWSPIDALWIGGFLLLGPVAIFAQYCNIRAFRAATAGVIGTVKYSWIIYAACFGISFFGESLTVSMMLGIALILMGGGWLASLRNRV